MRRAAWRRWRDFSEYRSSALWLLPSMSAVLALVVGWVLSTIDVDVTGPLSFLVFEGTADDARSLLVTVAVTMLGVLATVFGLAVVALQLSSTQFSPRLVRNFLRDGATQRVMSIFFATFAYAAAGLYTVGVGAGGRVDRYPRLAVSGALVLLFVSVAAVIWYADHLVHSLQIDVIMGVAARATLRVVAGVRESGDEPVPARPGHATAVPAERSGYLQTLLPGQLVRFAEQHRVTVALVPRIGDYVAAGTPLAHVWAAGADAARPDPTQLTRAVRDAVDLGFERTLQQDVAFGIRQLVDIACKALSPAVNDPYTAVQAVHHLTDVFVALAPRQLGSHILRSASGPGAVVIRGRRFGDYLAAACGQIRRYGASEPTVAVALLELVTTCAYAGGRTEDRLAVLGAEADLVLADAERLTGQPADLRTVHAAYAEVQRALGR